MPKKFSGENTKVTAAKDRKQKAKEASHLKKTEEDEEKWQDNSKLLEKKLKRKEEQAKKREEQIKRKAELKDLLKKETESITKTKMNNSSKITKAEIDSNINNKETKVKNDEGTKINSTRLTVSLTENLNRLSLDEIIARNIDEAVAALSDDKKGADRHPEKRLKAAHKAFEEKRIKELKAANPTRKLTQLKQMVFKEWQKLQGATAS